MTPPSGSKPGAGVSSPGDQSSEPRQAADEVARLLSPLSHHGSRTKARRRLLELPLEGLTVGDLRAIEKALDDLDWRDRRGLS
jgi:hypothetical protein